VSRAGWVGCYLDPNTFLDMWVTGSDLNTGGWSNTGFDELIERAAGMPASQERLDVLRRAEEILITEEMAVMPFFYYNRKSCIDTTKWGGWYENVPDLHPWKDIYRK